MKDAFFLAGNIWLYINMMALVLGLSNFRFIPLKRTHMNRKDVNERTNLKRENNQNILLLHGLGEY